MKKLAVLLSLVMVLGMAVSVAAADVTGSVKYEMKKVGDADATWTPTWELAINEVVEGATANIEFGSFVDETFAVDYLWVDFSDEAFPVDLTFGAWEWNDTDVEGIAGTYKYDAFTASAVFVPAVPGGENEFGFYGEYANSFAPVDVKAYAKNIYDVTTLYGKGTYNFDGFKVWADAKKAGDADVAFKVGGETNVVGITVKAQYDLDKEVAKLEASKKVKGITFAGSFETTDPDSTIKASAKVAF